MAYGRLRCAGEEHIVNLARHKVILLKPCEESARSKFLAGKICENQMDEPARGYNDAQVSTEKLQIAFSRPNTLIFGIQSVLVCGWE